MLTSASDAKPTREYGFRAGAAVKPLVSPDSIVVVGASQRPNGFGARALANAVASNLPGVVGSVNPNYDELQGRPCWRDIAAIPETVDCVIIAVPAASVIESVREILSLGKARSILIFSSGLGEAGGDGAAAEAELAELARVHQVPICGPNTIGILNFVDRRVMSFLTDVDMDASPSGALAIVSQSAGIGVGLSHARHAGVRLSHVLLAGNSCDLNVLDMAAYLVEDANVRAVGLALEGLDEPRKVLELGAIAREKSKTIVVLKTGRSTSAAAVVQSHTGSLIGTYELYEAAFERAGIVVVETIEDLLEIGTAFSKAPVAKGGGIGVLTNSGGAAVMSADHADEYRIALPQPAAATIAELKAIAPDFAAITNPADLTANMSQDWSMLTRAILAFANDPSYSAVIVPIPAPDLGPGYMARPNAIIEAARQSPVPICVVWLSGWREGPGVAQLESEPNILLFRSMKRCMQALSSWIHWSAKIQTPEPRIKTFPNEINARIAALIDAASAENSGDEPFVLDELRSREVLELIGISSAAGGFAADEDDAEVVATKIGYPVVVKGMVHGLAHKSDVGAVALNLKDGAEVRNACVGMCASLAEHNLSGRLDGFLVCRMESGGFEALVGASRDPLFGPTVAYGAGGTAVEQLKDVVLRLAPSSREEIRSEVEKLRSWNQLSGGRGAKARDIEALVDAALAVASLIASDPRIREIDVNPLLVRNVGEGAIALDALLTIGRP
ncbi:MAG TPA: acetate--CoA ligase family protein [Sphingobium sp.]|uniref:acetate--CoA ligase family protein n=1 Tax=Sphingobium sp. TaxID=1912891 RepID=UPI002ED25BDB